jgi:hypothetical protein
MNPKIKLSPVRKEDYENLAVRLNNELSKMPITLSLDLGQFFQGHDYTTPITIFASSDPIIERSADYYQLGFGIRPDEEDKKRIVNLARNGSLRSEVIEDWIRRKDNETEPMEDYEAQEMLELLLIDFEEDKNLFSKLIGAYYDIRYIPESNLLVSDDAYSGRLRNQGMMKYLFRNIGEVIDLSDLSGIKIGSIVESNTIGLFDAIVKKHKDPNKICENVRTEYLKSPFMRLLYGLGFRDMQLGVYKGEEEKEEEIYLGNVLGRKSEQLKFSLQVEED